MAVPVKIVTVEALFIRKGGYSVDLLISALMDFRLFGVMGMFEFRAVEAGMK